MTNTDLPPETAPRRAPIAIWRFARLLIGDIHNLFGAPENIAEAGAVSRALYKQMLHWIGAVEAMIRRLLFIEAQLILAGGGAPVAKPHRLHKQREKRLVTWHPHEPEKWRVTFRVFSERAGAAKRKASSRRQPPLVFESWPLALRCEALLRVFNDPIPFARRLARRLAARPQQPRAVAPALIRTVGGQEIWDELQSLCAAQATPVAVDSS